ncbi:ribonuclease III [Marinilabiliaceae bacterium JC017]|nr:ribonuclease III [Marinilabiliaceae bacterium JC017]
MLKPLLQIIELFSPRGKKFYSSIYQITGIRPGDIKLYELAMIHKSAMKRDSSGRFINNERLEFLGDAILGSVVAHELYLQFPKKNEGFLTKTRSRIVNRSFLNEIALKMRLNMMIKLQTRLDVVHTHILGDALEALIGAIYLDKGYQACQFFIRNKIIQDYVDMKLVAKKDSNYKSLLIEWCQKHKRNIKFTTEEVHPVNGLSPMFVSKALIDEVLLGEGEGLSKKEAQQNAARRALKQVKENVEIA